MKGLASIAVATAATVSAAGTVPDGAILVPMIRDEGGSAYYAEVQVGTPPQTIWLKVDTGSPTYSFIDSQNEVCLRPTEPCKTYGSYDNSTSSTSLYEGTGFHNALNNHGQGDYLNDTVSIAGVSTEHMYFGYVTYYGFPDRAVDPMYSILGMSLDCGDASSPDCTDKGPYMLPQLKQAGKIDRMVSSIYLGPDEIETAYPEMILGGFYDEAKVDGEMLTVNMVDPHGSLAIGQTNSVNVTGIDVIVNGSKTLSGSYGEPDVGLPVLMDTGVASWYLPDDIAHAVFEGLGGLPDGEFNHASPFQNINCAYRDPDNAKGHVTVHFGSTGKVDIPLHTLITQLSEDRCVTYVSARSNVPFIFGDPFLRGLYTIFDQENWTFTMSKVRYTRARKIVPLPEGGFKA